MTCRDALLRTLASIPTNRYVLVLGCTDGTYTAPLLRLGFPVHACSPSKDAVRTTRTAIADLMADPADTTECVQPCTPPALDDYPDSAFDWVVAPHLDAVYTSASADPAFDAVQRILKPGGWALLGITPATSANASSTNAWPTTSDTLVARCEAHDLLSSTAPQINDDTSPEHLYGLFQRDR